jgi:hypothetical protein
MLSIEEEDSLIDLDALKCSYSVSEDMTKQFMKKSELEPRAHSLSTIKLRTSWIVMLCHRPGCCPSGPLCEVTFWTAAFLRLFICGIYTYTYKNRNCFRRTVCSLYQPYIQLTRAKNEFFDLTHHVSKETIRFRSVDAWAVELLLSQTVEFSFSTGS